MASEIRANLITPASSTTVTIGGVGDTISCGGTASGFGGGKCLQVIGSTKTDPFIATSASPTIAFSASITPIATTSKMLISGHFCMSSNTDANTPLLYRDSTQICVADAYGAARRRGFIGTVKYEVGRTRQVSFSFYDESTPADITTPIVYSVKIVANTNQTIYIGRSYSGADQIWDGSGCSTMNIMEYGA
jgi:hypothetical protein